MFKVSLSEVVRQADRQAAAIAARRLADDQGRPRTDDEDTERNETPTSDASAGSSDAWDRTTRDDSAQAVRPLAATRVTRWIEPRVRPGPAPIREPFGEVLVLTPQEAGTLPILPHAPPHCG